MKPKYLDLIRVLERRVQAGDYALEELPSERKLAAELGVSHMTARRAVQHLIETGMIKRHSAHSRSTRSKSLLKIACLMPAFESNSHISMFRSLVGIVQARQGIVRGVSYTGWHDPVIMDVLGGDFDGIFFLPPPDMPQVMVDRIVREKARLVTVFYDSTDLGIPCVDSGCPDAVKQIVDHLASLGHRNIAMINTQPRGPAIASRIGSWRKALAEHQIGGELFDEPVESMGLADMRAMELAERLIARGVIGRESPATAVITTTLEIARAVLRIMANHGLHAPADISVATCDQVRVAQQMVPSITTLETPPADEFLKIGLDWILSRGLNWDRPLMIRPENVPVWIGESTAPPRAN